MTSHSSTFVEFDAAPDAASAIPSSAGQVRFVRVPAQRFLMIDGVGVPGGIAYREAMSALYPVAWTLHFALKSRARGGPVGALEGVYWTADEPRSGDQADECVGPSGGPPQGRERGRPANGARPVNADGPGPASLPPGDLHWRLMLPVPADATPEDIDAAIAEVRARKAPVALERLRVETLAEGPAAQVLHVGPYDRESATLERLHEAIRAAGLRPCGHHHEIYVSDPNRTATERLKTVIRQPVAVDGPG